MKLQWHDVVYLWGVASIYLLRSWFTGKAVDMCEHIVIVAEKRLVKSEKEAIAWVHFRNRAAKLDHAPSTVVACNDGRCIEVTK